MFGTHFYNEGMRRLTIAFGQIFNKIVVQTKDANGSVVKRFTVPLAYAPKEKFIVRLTQQGDLTDKQFATVLPRMGFEISGIEYDPSRKLNYKNLENQTQMVLLRIKLIKWTLTILQFHIT